MVMKEQVIEVLKTCFDPELMTDVWTLELIYNIKIEKEKIMIDMTYTTPMCPYGQTMVEDIKQKVKALKGVKTVIVNVVFDPPWKPSDALREMFGL
ncbi:MAG: DUF59 domain-containing protein [Candidatus Aenigmarchaeota archaeon]|nr:DUF59 domain-containing protein [Candidatus Aenigmarchaeota archaeon]